MVVPAGQWVTGPLQMRSNVRLLLSSPYSVLKATTNLTDWPVVPWQARPAPPLPPLPPPPTLTGTPTPPSLIGGDSAGVQVCLPQIHRRLLFPPYSPSFYLYSYFHLLSQIGQIGAKVPACPSKIATSRNCRLSSARAPVRGPSSAPLFASAPQVPLFHSSLRPSGPIAHVRSPCSSPLFDPSPRFPCSIPYARPAQEWPLKPAYAPHLRYRSLLYGANLTGECMCTRLRLSCLVCSCPPVVRSSIPEWK